MKSSLLGEREIYLVFIFHSNFQNTLSPCTDYFCAPKVLFGHPGVLIQPWCRCPRKYLGSTDCNDWHETVGTSSSQSPLYHHFDNNHLQMVSLNTSFLISSFQSPSPSNGWQTKPGQHSTTAHTVFSFPQVSIFLLIRMMIMMMIVVMIRMMIMMTRMQ